MPRCRAWRGKSCLVWRLRAYWFLKRDVVKVAGGRLVVIAAAGTELHCAHPLRISRRRGHHSGALRISRKSLALFVLLGYLKLNLRRARGTQMLLRDVLRSNTRSRTNHCFSSMITGRSPGLSFPQSDLTK